MKIRVWGACAALGLVLPIGLTAPAHAAPAVPAKPFDLNGDGRAELVVGAPDLRVGSVKGAGGVVVLPGSKDGPTTKETVITQASTGVPGGPETGDAFGYATASADFDLDGYADLAIGAPGETVGTNEGGGSVTIVPGSAKGPNTTKAYVITVSGSGRLGTALVAADLSGDGRPDLAVGSPSEDYTEIEDEDYGPSGVVHVFLGTSGGVSQTNPIDLRRKGGTKGFDVDFGSLLAAGDLGGAGTTDLVVGSAGDRFVDEGYPGSVSVCLAKTGGPTGCSQIVQDRHLANMSALAVGNTSGSRAAEIVVGSYLWNEEDPGLVTLLQLDEDDPTTVVRSTEITEASPGVPGSAEYDDAFGASVALGQIDGDAYADLVIGAPWEDADRGRVTVVRGASGGYATSGNYLYDQATKGVPGSSEKRDDFGASVALLDLTGDGKLDLAVGAPGEDGDDGAVTTLRGSGTSFTTKGAKAFTLKSLGYKYPTNAYLGDNLGVAPSS